MHAHTPGTHIHRYTAVLNNHSDIVGRNIPHGTPRADFKARLRCSITTITGYEPCFYRHRTMSERKIKRREDKKEQRNTIYVELILATNNHNQSTMYLKFAVDWSNPYDKYVLFYHMMRSRISRSRQPNGSDADRSITLFGQHRQSYLLPTCGVVPYRTAIESFKHRSVQGVVVT